MAVVKITLIPGINKQAGMSGLLVMERVFKKAVSRQALRRQASGEWHRWGVRSALNPE
jgi:hypothetical protein